MPLSDRLILTPGEASFELDGTYRLLSEACDVEIEMVDEQTSLRSVIYVKRERLTVLAVPKGRYGLYVRILAGPGRQVAMAPMTGWERLAFLTSKAIALLGKPPHESIAAVTGALRARRNKQIVGAVAGSAAAAEALSANREVMPPADVAAGQVGVSIVIPTKERLDLLRACIESLAMVRDTPFEIIVVDNGADHPDMRAYLAELDRREDARVLRRDIPFNFSRLCNDGARLARHPLTLFLNDDIEAQDGLWLSAMVRYAMRADVGVTGARLLYPGGDLQHAGIAANLVPGPGHPWRGASRDVWSTLPLLALPGEVDAVTGACLMIRTDLFASVGGFDEGAFAVTLNDVDLCLRVRETGLKVVYVPQATLWHKESQTRRPDDRPEERGRYHRELAEFLRRYPVAARRSVFYPAALRRDSDRGLII